MNMPEEYPAICTIKEAGMLKNIKKKEEKEEKEIKEKKEKKKKMQIDLELNSFKKEKKKIIL